MRVHIFLKLAVFLTPSLAATSMVNFNLDFESTIGSFKAVLESMKYALQVKSDVIRRLTEQTMRDQIRQEERVRSEGDSGIVQTRNFEEGTQNYHSSTAAEHSFAGLYDRVRSRDKVGLGEMVVIMNGVEFRIHRSDHKLEMPHRTSSGFLDTEPIQRPPVPPSVLSKGTVQAQAEEMAEYFRAFKDQNSTHRNYKAYFQPILCYLEAAWMVDPGADAKPGNWFTAVDKIYLGGNTWSEVHDRIRTEFVTGTRSQRSAYLPSIITHIEPDTGEPVYAQWNFRPMCQPIAEDLPTKYFRQFLSLIGAVVVQWIANPHRDLQGNSYRGFELRHQRIACRRVKDYSYAGERGMTVDETLFSKGAHFVLDDKDEPGYGTRKVLEELVSQVPGLDNGPAHLNRTLYQNLAEKDWEGRAILNAGYYSHWYNIGYVDGRFAQPRGFSDRNLFVAGTTQAQIAEIPVTFCPTRHGCTKQRLKVSYMLPLEIIYMTPLESWNPHKLRDFGTPAEFFDSQHPSVDPDPMDDGMRKLWFLDGQNVPRLMVPSGVRTILPSIFKGVGQVRTRFPIAPVHARGSTIWKELSAYIDSASE
ncbi:hypothetical protein PoB_005549300 [Plakobranchus ocellatus]|uniref:Uncharacterized protein n=1 Tax=Plakobranchus ocellatus TaxID=259542 RepID=A0AAV4CAU9_9GAST|nr:hypothetical protein PoB_005549300 [Plakobranchus ocellatus]